MMTLVSPCLSSFFSASTVCYIYIFTTPPTYKAIIVSLQPCALNADFQDFIPRFNKISLLLWVPLRKGFGGERLPKDDDLQIILVLRHTHPRTFTQGHVNVFDKYLHWPQASVKNK